MAMNVAAIPSISRGRMAAFAVGDYGFNLYWQSVSLFLLFYYTDTVGLSAAVAGLIYMCASIFDGAMDPFMGAIAERSRSRWGRYRPYLLFGAVPLGISFAFLYYKPPTSGALLLTIVVIAHLLFRVCYTAISIPYTSLTARITASSGQRSELAGLRMIFATLAGLTVASVTLPMVGRLGGGNDAHGFLYVACIFAAIATVIFPLVFLVTHEPAEPPGPRIDISLDDYWRAIIGNRAFLTIIGGILFSVICATALGKSILYYFKYYLHDEAGATTALSVGAACGLIILPAWLIVSKYLGKRLVWLTASIWGLVGLAYFAVTDIRSTEAMTIYLVYMQVSSLGLALAYWSIIPDTVEYGEWRTGIRAEAFIFGLSAFFLKAALGVGAGAFGVALTAVGYIPNAEQSAETLHGMKMIMVLFPAVGLIISASVMYFYPMRRGTHESIVEQLGARHATPPDAADLDVVV